MFEMHFLKCSDFTKKRKETKAFLVSVHIHNFPYQSKSKNRILCHAKNDKATITTAQ